jgi:hypothetical protein
MNAGKLVTASSGSRMSEERAIVVIALLLNDGNSCEGFRMPAGGFRLGLVWDPASESLQ